MYGFAIIHAQYRPSEENTEITAVRVGSNLKPGFHNRNSSSITRRQVIADDRRWSPNGTESQFS